MSVQPGFLHFPQPEVKSRKPTFNFLDLSRWVDLTTQVMESVTLVGKKRVDARSNPAFVTRYSSLVPNPAT